MKTPNAACRKTNQSSDTVAPTNRICCLFLLSRSDIVQYQEGKKKGFNGGTKTNALVPTKTGTTRLRQGRQKKRSLSV